MRILLIRLREIGDVVFTTPAIQALRQRFPTAHLAYVVEPHAAPVVEHNPSLNEVIVAPAVRGYRGLLADLALGRKLKRGAYDLAIDFHGGPRASLLTWLSAAPERIGYEVVGRGWMYTRRVHRPRGLRPRHSVANQWDLLASLDVGPPDADRFPVEMPVRPDVRDAVADRLRTAGVAPDSRVVVMHVSAGNPFRRWPVESFGEVAATLARESDVRVIISSGPSDADAARRVIADARKRLPPEQEERVLACGEFSLAELRALVDHAAVYIGGDSGPMHIAATSHVPIVSLYGPTLPTRSAPWRAASLPAAAVEVQDLPCRPCDQRVCAPGDFRCLTRISPADVIGPAERLLHWTSSE